MNIVPVNDYLIVEVIEPTKQSKGGIIIPDQYVEESHQGRVVKVNPVSYYRNGDLRQPICDVGDVVVFAKKSGTKVTQVQDGKTYLAIPEDCIYYKVLEG